MPTPLRQPGNPPTAAWRARFRLHDVNKDGHAGGAAFPTPSAQLPPATRIADAIYEKLTGELRRFSTRIAYVVKVRRSLRTADCRRRRSECPAGPGFREPIISPTWSPDGTGAYVLPSRTSRSSRPFAGHRKAAVVANFQGVQLRPGVVAGWLLAGHRADQDGWQFASTPTVAGGWKGPGARRRRPIDTEPLLGSRRIGSLYFISGRGGPQIYRAADGGGAQRVTLRRKLTSLSRRPMASAGLHHPPRGRFQLAVMDLASRQVQVLTDSNRRTSPSFAPTAG